MEQQHSWASALLPTLSWETVRAFVFAVLPVWALGALTGMLLPRPKLLDETHSESLSGIRELLYKLGHLFKAIVLWARGKGWHYDSVSAAEQKPLAGAGVPEATVADAAPQPEKWYVTSADLALFHDHAEQDGGVPGSGPWEVMMDKDVPGYTKYTAWRRNIPGGTEYKSVTICPNASAEEFIDLYFDDDYRPTWDPMVISHEVLEHGDFSQRQQVVRWRRHFPFGFITDRQYTIARRLFREGDALYAICKAIKHPAPSHDDATPVDVFYSMWRSRTIPCPWGTSNPAVETLLLHHEQMKIPENMSKFAVRHGMWGFVKSVADNMQTFIQQRRARGVSPHEADPRAFGAGYAPNPPAQGRSRTLGNGSTGGRSGGAGVALSGNSASEGGTMSANSDNGHASEDEGSAAGSAGRGYGPRSSSPNSFEGRTSSNVRRLKGLAAFAIAGSLAILMGGNPSGGGAPAGGSDGGRGEGMVRRGGSLRGSRATLDGAAGTSSSIPFGAEPSELRSKSLGRSRSSGLMRRSVSVASALDSRRRRQQQYRFMQDPAAYWDEPLTE